MLKPITVALLFTGAIYGSNLLTNPSFEAGLSGWTVTNQPGSSGSWFAQTGTVSPMSAFAVPAPPDGTTAAMTDQSGAGSHALSQSFTLPGPASSVILSFLLFRGNRAGAYSAPGTLDYTVSPNQQARVDILTAGASAFDVGAGVVRNVFQTLPGDPLVDAGYNLYTFNITPQVGAGGTFQLRFAEADNQLFFQLGVDRVSVDFTAVPEPGTVTLLLGGLLTVLGIQVRRRC